MLTDELFPAPRARYTGGMPHVGHHKGANVMTEHFIGMSGTHGCLPDYCAVFDSAEDAAENIVTMFELDTAGNVDELVNTGYLELPNGSGADYAEIIACTCETPDIHSDN